MRNIVRVLVPLVTAGYLALVLTGTISAGARLGWVELGLVLLAVLVVGNFFDQLAELSFGKEGIKINLRTIESKQLAQGYELAAIKVALTGLVTRYELDHLTGLNGTAAYNVQFGNIFFDEIRRLDAIGFIRVTESYKQRGFNAIKEEHESIRDTFDLKRYMEITEEGKFYLAARSQASAPIAPPPKLSSPT